MKTLARELWHSRERLAGSTAKKGILSVLDQGLVSGNTFVTNLICLRVLSKEEYGVFAILFTIYLFFNHVQSALVTWPLSVLSKGKEHSEEKRYIGSTLLQQLVLSGVVAFTLLLGMVGLWFFGYVESEFYPGLLALALAIVPLQFLEYVRRLFFMKLDPQKALHTDVVFTGTNVLLLLGLVLGLREGFLELAVSRPALVLGCLGTAAALACLFAFVRARDYHTLKGIRYSDSLRENWVFGRWYLGGYAGSVGMVQANTWIIGAMGGVIAAGAVESARLLLAPLHLLSQGLGNFALPLLSERFATGGSERLSDSLLRAYPLWIALTLLYCSVVLVAPGFWVKVILGNHYSGNEDFVLMWTGIMFLAVVLAFPHWILSAMRRPDAVMYITLCGGVVVVFSTFVLINVGGAIMGLGGRLVGEIVVLALTGGFLFRHLSKRKAKRQIREVSLKKHKLHGD